MLLNKGTINEDDRYIRNYPILKTILQIALILLLR
jgi:hypothetical protein